MFLIRLSLSSIGSRHHHQVLPLIEKDSSVSNHSATPTTSQFSAAPPCRHRRRCSIGGFSQQKHCYQKNPKSQERGCLPPIEPSSERPEFKNFQLFEPRPPLEYKPPPEKRKCPPYTGMAQFVSHFAEPTDHEYAPPIVKGETPGQRRARIHRLRTNFEFITLTLSLWLRFVHFDDRDLSYNFFNGSIPESLGGLTSVRILNLNGNSLSGRVPAAVGGTLYTEQVSNNRSIGKKIRNGICLNKVNSSYPPAAKEQVVGWPPVTSFYKNILATNSNKNDEVDGKPGPGALQSTYRQNH
ncbi:unnamed protein product [Lactuca virosa]|uniref:Auxin-responsive protein n=1 Tax=Lactuca virosa TaxID=75947 RepID=A0AAU9MG83_9ASTR|nr:unnamed protein product [Lactuca virosa]